MNEEIKMENTFDKENSCMIKPPANGEHLQSHDLVYRGTVEYWQSGIPLGNGDTDAVAFQQVKGPLSFCFGITRAGLFDRRCPIQLNNKTHRDIMRMWKEGKIDDLHEWDLKENCHYMKYPYPNIRAAGLLSLTPCDERDRAEPLMQVLSLQNAVLSQKAPDFSIESFVIREYDCLCIEIKGGTAFSLAFTPNIDYPDKGKHWWDNSGCIDNEINSRYEAVDNGFVGYFSFSGQEYSTAVLVDNAVIERMDMPGSIVLTPGAGGQPMHVYLTVSTLEDGSDYTAQTLKRAEAVRTIGFELLKSRHIQDWHKFWSINLLLLEDKFLENLFYLEQYILRCGLEGRRVFGSMTPWHLGTQPWHADMHSNINVEMLWLSVFALNRAELSDSFDSHFAQGLEDARNETKRFWELPGLAYPFASLGNLKPIHGGYWRYEIYVSAWLAQVFWERYCFTGDIEYLENTCYPIQKEVLLFYENYLEVDNEGKYYFPMSKPVESQEGPDGSRFARDLLLDIAALRQLLEAAITASELLDRDMEKRHLWRKILDNLIPLPTDEERKMFVSYSGASPDLPNDHPTLLGALYPSGLRLSDNEIECVKNSLEHIFKASKREIEGFPFKKILVWGDDLSYSWITIVSARLGQRENVYAYLYDLLILLQLKRNGLFTSRPSDTESRDKKVSIYNTVGGFMTALTEMFLQSFDGIIRVFPATPEKYTSAFSGLKTRGNFTVDAAQKKGKLVYVKIFSGSGGIAEIRNDWGEVCIADDSGNRTVTDKRIIKLETVKGKTYIIKPNSDRTEKSTLAFETGKRSSPRIWTGPCFLEKLPEKDGWIITLGQ